MFKIIKLLLAATLTCAIAACSTTSGYYVEGKERAFLDSVYQLFTENGFKMKKPQSTELYEGQHWDETDTDKGIFIVGAFVNYEKYPNTTVMVTYFANKELHFYVYGQEEPIIAFVRKKYGSELKKINSSSDPK